MTFAHASRCRSATAPNSKRSDRRTVGLTRASLSGIASADTSTLARALFQHARRDAKLKVIPAVERELIIQAVIETQGNQVQAARLLGITRATLRKRVEKFGIKQGLAIQ